MRVVLQRVSEASVRIDKQVKGRIARGLVVLLGIEAGDSQKDIEWLVRKILHMRIFNDAQGKMNLSVMDVGGELLVISQFTLHASTRKGNRPSWIKAAKPEEAIPLYEAFLATLEQASGKKPACGTFGAYMQIELCNDGPVTILLDSKQPE